MKRNWLISVAGLALVSAAVWAAPQVSGLGVQGDTGIDVTLTAQQQYLTCAGALALPYDDVSADSDFDPRASLNGSEQILVLPAERQQLDNLQVHSFTNNGSRARTVAETDEYPVYVGSLQQPSVWHDFGEQAGQSFGITLQTQSRGDLAGVSTHQCWPLQTSGIFTPVQAELGVSLPVLHLTNPHDQGVEVQLQAWSALGEIPLDSNATLTIPAQTTRTVLVQALISQPEPFALQISSTTLPLAMALQQTQLSGLEAKGTDWQTAVQPRDHLAMTSVPIAEDSSLQALAEDSSVLEVAVWDEDGTKVAHFENVQLEGGELLAIPLTGIAAGNYAIEAVADVPFVMGAQSSTGTDLTWASGQQLATSVGIGLPRQGVYDSEISVLIPGLGASAESAEESTAESSSESTDEVVNISVEYTHRDGRSTSEQLQFRADSSPYRVLQLGADVVGVRIDGGEQQFFAAGLVRLPAEHLQGLSHLSVTPKDATTTELHLRYAEVTSIQ